MRSGERPLYAAWMLLDRPRLLRRVPVVALLGGLTGLGVAAPAHATLTDVGTYKVVSGEFVQHDEYLRHAESHDECYDSVFDDKGTTTTKLKPKARDFVDAKLTGHGVQVTGFRWSGTTAIDSDFQVRNVPVADPPPGCVGLPAPKPGSSSGCGTKRVTGSSMVLVADKHHRLEPFGPLYDVDPFSSPCESDSPYASVVIPGAASAVTSSEVIEGKRRQVLHFQGTGTDNDVASLVSLIPKGSGYHHAKVTWKLTLMRVGG
ncbi:MAG: hypothetical protein JWM31_1865 [Solirubrobacterales bacterium]|nr:hypothetical protein [Solirubrobacterales bacterium]